MNGGRALSGVLLIGLLALLAVWPVQTSGDTSSQDQPITLPKPGVPQVSTIEGKFVRASYNN